MSIARPPLAWRHRHREAAPASTVAEALAPLVRRIVGTELPVAVRFWDGSALGPADGPATIVVRSPAAVRRLITAPNELGLGRAYVAGDIDVEGDLDSLFGLWDRLVDGTGRVSLDLGPSGWLSALQGARDAGALGLPPRPPAEEIHLRGRIHSRLRDRKAVSSHYDVGNDFYRLVLGPSLTYSCAYFADATESLEVAQERKYELIAAKLGLEEGMRLLDVGCGWGGMVLHAAAHHGVRAVGVTVSDEQWRLARERVEARGLCDRVEIRRADYREIDDGPYDAISSIGMYEHVGSEHLEEYLGILFRLLRPEGRLLNHGISRPWAPPGRLRPRPRSFMERYVFPDGELHEVGAVVTAMQRGGFEVRDVQSLREHYALTLRRWTGNLERRWPEAVALVGPGRARIWRLYMAGCAVNFEAGRTNIHQVLAVRPTPTGGSGMPLRRLGVSAPPHRDGVSSSTGAAAPAPWPPRSAGRRAPSRSG
ncbi:MAG TPA: class I SAM-dependent methyltransferase [Acidimicrobiia bacterium]|nr:class I SAM-dependent methyltransferase [Acidimicrobiia bacterium]